MKKPVWILILLLAFALTLSGCGGTSSLRGTYASEDGRLTMVFDKLLYLVMEDDVALTTYSVRSEENQLVIGTDSFDFVKSEDGKTLQIDGASFVSTRRGFAMTCRIILASARAYIREVGVIRWLLLPFSPQAINAVGGFGVSSAVIGLTTP